MIKKHELDFERVTGGEISIDDDNNPYDLEINEAKI